MKFKTLEIGVYTKLEFKDKFKDIQDTSILGALLFDVVEIEDIVLNDIEVSDELAKEIMEICSNGDLVVYTDRENPQYPETAKLLKKIVPIYGVDFTVDNYSK